jgi:hypothetical protein
MNIGEIGWRDMDWIGLDHDKDKWRGPENAVMNCCVP